MSLKIARRKNIIVTIPLAKKAKELKTSFFTFGAPRVVTKGAPYTVLKKLPYKILHFCCDIIILSLVIMPSNYYMH